MANTGGIMCDKDTASGLMDTEDGVLELTAVYGTQIVSIKTEEDTEIVIKEEGPTIDIEHGELCSDQNSMPIHNLTQIAMVYTTRLDDMDTFNNIGRHTSEEVTEMILEESKPQYEALKFPEPQPGLPSDPCINSYIKLCSQIQQLNAKVKRETLLRNQKLLNMCKPLQIVLEDLKTSERTSRTKTMLKYSLDENLPSHFYFSDDDDEPLTTLLNIVGETSLLGKKHKAAPIALFTVAVKDKRSQEADIYILDAKKGVKSYYRTNMKECDTLEKLHDSKKTILIEYCCWVNREKRIGRLIQLGLTRPSLFYLRKPHNCLPRPCSCCCFYGTPMVSKGNLLSQNKELLDNKEVSAPVNRNSVIDKAKNYIPNVPDSLTVKNEPVDYLESAVIIIKYHRVIFSQTHILGDNYEIGKHGELFNFMRPSVNRSIPEEKQLYEKSETVFENSRQYFTYLICCWHNREVIIKRLVDINNLNPNVLIFIRTPHPCRSDKCICCCKPRPFVNLYLNNVSTFQKSTKRQKKVPAVTRDREKQNTATKDKEKRITTSSKSNLPIRTLNKDADIDIQSKKTNNRRKSTRTINETKLPVGLKQIAAQASNNMSFDSRTVHYSGASSSQTATKTQQNEPTVNQFIDLTSADTASNSSPSMLMNSILDKFKGLVLTVNANGKLTAIINAAPGTLSNEDIKLISDILLLASSRIERLGITPQEFCNGVNSSRAGSMNALMPQLVPITLKSNDALTPDTKAHNTLPTPLEYDTPKAPSCCKVQPLSSNRCIPTTSNTSNVCSIYQAMSSLGGQKNQNLVRAYKLHFKDVYMVENYDQLIRQQQQQNAKKLLKTKRDRVKVTTSEASTVTKRKATQQPDQDLKKLRVKPSQEFRVKTSLDGLGNNRIDQTDSKSFIDTRKSSHTNLLPEQNTRGKDIPQIEMRAEDNQMLQSNALVSNGNFILGQKKEETASQPTVGSFHGQVPFIVANNHSVIPEQNTCRKDVARATTTTNPPPLIVANNNVLPVPNTSGMHVPRPEIYSKMVAGTGTFVTSPTNDETPAANRKIIDITEPLPFRVDCGFDEDVTESDIDAPLASKSDSMPMQNIINAVVSNVALKPKGPVPSVNPLLHQMLSQAHASPSLPPVDPKAGILKPLIHNNHIKKKASVRSHRAHSNKETSKNYTRAYKRKPKIYPPDDTNVDFESSIKSTMIAVNHDKFTNDEILDAVNNKQLIASDEEEGIFGV